MKGCRGFAEAARVARGLWAPHTAGIGGAMLFLLFSFSVSAQEVGLPLSIETGTDRPGQDYRSRDLAAPDPESCRAECAADVNCKAYTYVKTGIQGPSARCYLKSTVPQPRPNDCCISGVRTRSGSVVPSVEESIDRPGLDYRRLELSDARAELCRVECANDPKCKAYTYVQPGLQGPRPVCYLKSQVPRALPNQCCVSGFKGTRAELGLPVSEELRCRQPDGRDRYQLFQGGRTYYQAATKKTLVFYNPVNLGDDGNCKLPRASSEANLNQPALCQVHLEGVKQVVATLFGEDTLLSIDILPAWTPVETGEPVVLEGEVVSQPGCYPGPHVSYEDLPINHYSHDFTFFVRPDQAYVHLLGLKPGPCENVWECQQRADRIAALKRELGELQSELVSASPALKPVWKNKIDEWRKVNGAEVNRLLRELGELPKAGKPQPLIEVEWESGLGASNSPPVWGRNPTAPPNLAGASSGFFSAGHARYNTIWNWPTTGDRVHIVGNWIWDRGHPPAVTEIHPPRLVATQRKLPTLAVRCKEQRSRLTALEAELRRLQNIPATAPEAVRQKRLEQIAAWHLKYDGELAALRRTIASAGCAPLLGSRIDVFASGDGGAYWHNREQSWVPSFVRRVAMNDRDYSFIVKHRFTKPSQNSQLRFSIERHKGDTFGGSIEVVPNATTGEARVIIPWKTDGVPRDRVLARTILLYWDEGTGVEDISKFRRFRVTLDEVLIWETHDDTPTGEYRMFAEVAGNWLFLNEFASNTTDILNEGFGSSSRNQRWPIGKQFEVLVPVGESFRVHAGGWEADGVNRIFGQLVPPDEKCTPQAVKWLTDTLFSAEVVVNGAWDDPIGEVNNYFLVESDNVRKTRACNLALTESGIGPHYELSAGKKEDVPVGPTDPQNSYRLIYRVEQLPLPWQFPAARLGRQ